MFKRTKKSCDIFTSPKINDLIKSEKLRYGSSSSRRICPALSPYAICLFIREDSHDIECMAATGFAVTGLKSVGGTDKVSQLRKLGFVTGDVRLNRA